MKIAPEDLLALPYAERQLIVVESDEAVEMVRAAEADDSSDSGLGGGARGVLVGAVSAASGAVVVGAALSAAVQLWKARRRAVNASLRYRLVTSTQAAALVFPNGHPLGQVVYVGDPGVVSNYYPVASFHRVLFEGKVAEVLRLLRSLGATEVSIEYLQGFDRCAGVDLSGSLVSRERNGHGLSAEAGRKVGSTAKTTMQLSPTRRPQIPKNLVWYRSEPLWQEVARARLESGLRAFTLEVSYSDDFGINGSLKSRISKVGLQLGGKFTEYEETKWRLSGTFAS